MIRPLFSLRLRAVRKLAVVVLVAALALGYLGYTWLNDPLQMASDSVDLSVEPGSSPREVALQVQQAGVSVNPTLLYWLFRLSGEARQIKAGSYELERGTNPRNILSKLVRGEEALRSVTLVEGWNLRQVRAALARAEQLKPDSQGMDEAALMQALGRAGTSAEGRFYPDTYNYAKGSSDLAVLKRAMKAMDKQLGKVWQIRSPLTAVKSPEEALILASIVEKETGKASDRPQISGVFNNRLRIGMLMQTDPTVIYGLGASFDGNLRRRDLRTDSPYNTYTRAGLPPTPIAMPGKASLLAAVQPADTRAVYFVAKGDGSSHFSATLDEHNRAVNRFQRGQK